MSKKKQAIEQRAEERNQVDVGVKNREDGRRRMKM